MCMNTLERVLLCFYYGFDIFNVFLNRQSINEEYFPTKWKVDCRTRGARAHNLVSHLPFRVDIFVHGNDFSFR